MGAIITIAALAVDPFSQQIIQSEPCLQNITGAAAEIPKSQNFEAGIILSEPMINLLSGSLQAAIYMGLLSPPPNSSVAMTADCRTGNCDFPSDDGATFSTLAMCHSCVDISHTIHHDLRYGLLDDTDVALSSGVYIGSGTLFASTANTSFFDHSVFSFEALMKRELQMNTDNFAVACGITPCLKTFGANVTNGVYQERELSSIDLIWSDRAGYTLATNRTLRDGTWQSCTTTTKSTTASTLRINTTTMGLISRAEGTVEYGVSSGMDFEQISHGASLWYPDDCVWWFGSLPAQAISSFLHGFFDGNTLRIATESAIEGDLWLFSMFPNGTASMDTVNAFMSGLTWSVTAALRQAPASEGTPREQSAVSGQAQMVQTCLTVRWAWLSLPASLLGLQLVFLVAIVAISGSAGHWRGDWKDSSLALLYHGLEGCTHVPDEKVEREELRDRGGMFKVAQRMRVQLRQGQDNWRFHTLQ